MRALIVLLSVSIAFAPLAATAQSAPQPPSEGQTSQDQLSRLAQILGSLQYVQTLCAPTQGDFWRDRMMEMIRLEKPSVEQKNALVEDFNSGYQAASARFPTCTGEAQSYSSDLARQGEALAQSISDTMSANAQRTN